MFTWQDIGCHFVPFRLVLALDFSSDKSGPIRPLCFSSSSINRLWRPGDLRSARLHLGSCNALCSYIRHKLWIVVCSLSSWHCHPSSRHFCCLHQDLAPFTSAAHSTPIFRRSPTPGGKHIEHGEVQENSVRYDNGLRAAPHLLLPFLMYGRLENSYRKDTHVSVLVNLQLLACITAFSL